MSDTKLLKLSGDGDGDGDGDWIVDAELPDGRLVIGPEDAACLCSRVVREFSAGRWSQPARGRRLLERGRLEVDPGCGRDEHPAGAGKRRVGPVRDTVLANALRLGERRDALRLGER
jgi:hypothetical protein